MIDFKKISDEDKPRERLIKCGAVNLSNEELLTIILKTGTKGISVKELACQILAEINSIKELKNFSLNTLCQIKGMGKVKSIELLATVELGRRIYQDTSLEELISCTSPSNIINYFHDLFKDSKQEEFYVIYLDNQKKFIGKKMLFKGSANASIAHPREIFKEAYLLSASYLICLHNHPSGNPTPSREDIDLTRKLKEIGLIHAIALLDHIIIGENCYYSFYEDNKLK